MIVGYTGNDYEIQVVLNSYKTRMVELSPIDWACEIVNEDIKYYIHCDATNRFTLYVPGSTSGGEVVYLEMNFERCKILSLSIGARVYKDNKYFKKYYELVKDIYILYRHNKIKI